MLWIDTLANRQIGVAWNRFIALGMQLLLACTKRCPSPNRYDTRNLAKRGNRPLSQIYHVDKALNSSSTWDGECNNLVSCKDDHCCCCYNSIDWTSLSITDTMDQYSSRYIANSPSPRERLSLITVNKCKDWISWGRNITVQPAKGDQLRIDGTNVFKYFTMLVSTSQSGTLIWKPLISETQYVLIQFSDEVRSRGGPANGVTSL